ncbi:MAG TPA: hypothetical protein VGB53_08930 [Rubricoccaceae bacterium]
MPSAALALRSGLTLLLAAPLAGCVAAPPVTATPASATSAATHSAVAEPPGAARRNAPGAARADSLVADVAVIRQPEGGSSVFVSFRGSAAVAVSGTHALRVETPVGTFEATLVGMPAVAVQGDATVTSAEYRLGEAGTLALDRAGNTARLGFHDGMAVRSVGVRRSDLFE